MKDFLCVSFWAGLIGGFIYLVCFSDWSRENAIRQHAQDVADAKPHVIREADDCKVYAFKSDGQFHFFTKCGDGTVTTERNWEEHRQSGKQTITEHKSETIVTTGNK